MCRESGLALLLLVSAAHAALPNGWQACKRSSPDYDACFMKEVSNGIGSLMNGDKKLGVLPLDPLRLDSVVIPKHDGPVSLNLEFKDLDIIGLSKLKFLSLKNDWKVAVGSVHIPDLYAIGQYKVDGKVLVLPIIGQGPCNFTFHDTNFDIEFHWKESNIKGKKHYEMERLKLVIKPKRLYMQMDNLFNGDKALGDNMNVFINENWQEILKELNPPVSDALSQALTQISNRVLSKIPADQIDLK